MASRSKTRKKTNKASNKFLILIPGLAGLLLIGYGSYLKYRVTILSFKDTPPVTIAENKPVIYTNPVMIEIPSLELNLPVIESQIIKGVWEVSDTGVSHLNTSAKPGMNGNIVLYGHNKKILLGPLIGKIKQGDLIIITLEDGKRLHYKTSRVFITTPDDVDVIMPTDHEILTLYTCTGVLDSKRLIVKALPTTS